MTISSTTARNDYVGTDALATYSYTFKIFIDEDLLVTTKDLSDVETTLVVDVDYTVTDAGETAGGTITLTAGNLATGYTLTIRRNRSLTQETDIRNQGDFFPEVHEDEFDSQIMIDQGQQDLIDRSLKLPESVPLSDFDPELPADFAGAIGKAIITNATGDGIATAASSPDASSIASAEGFASAAALSAAASAVSAGTLSPYGINNLGLLMSVAANALTIAIKEADGTSDPASGTDSVTIYFRSTTLTSGAKVERNLAAAESLVVPSGATLGHNDGEDDFIYVYAIDDSGSIRLAVASTDDWDEGELQSTTAISAASDDEFTLYATSTLASVPIRLIGRIKSNQVTAGTWALLPTEIEVGFLFNKEQDTATTSVDNITADTTISPLDDRRVFLVDTTGGVVNITLADPTLVEGIRYIVRDTGEDFFGNNCNLVRNGSENIEGAAANFSLKVRKGMWEFVSDGTDYWFVSLPQSDLDVAQISTQTATGVTAARFLYNLVALTNNPNGGFALNAGADTFTHPEKGLYKAVLELTGVVPNTTAATLTAVMRNVTQASDANLSVGPSQIAGSRFNFGYHFCYEVPDETEDYSIELFGGAGVTTIDVTGLGQLTIEKA